MKERFLPDFSGCVKKEPRAARAVERLWREELEAVSAYLWREILIGAQDPALAELFEELAVEAAYRFRFLGGLLTALGGNRSLRSQIRLQDRFQRYGEERLAQDLLYDSLCQGRRICTRYREAMEEIEDGVTRSALACLMEDLEGLEERLNRCFG